MIERVRGKVKEGEIKRKTLGIERNTKNERERDETDATGVGVKAVQRGEYTGGASGYQLSISIGGGEGVRDGGA